MFAAPGPFAAPPPLSPHHLGLPRRTLRAPVSDPDPATTWHRIRREIRGNVNEATWHIWLERVSFRALDGTTLVLQAPDDVRSWVQGRFARVLNDCAASVLGAGARVEIVGPDDDLPPAQAQASSRERAHSMSVFNESLRYMPSHEPGGAGHEGGLYRHLRQATVGTASLE